MSLASSPVGRPRDRGQADRPWGRRLRDGLSSPRRLLDGLVSPARSPAIVPLEAANVPIMHSSNGGDALRLPARIEGGSREMTAEVVARDATPISPPAARLARIADATITAGVVQLRDRTIVEESLLNTARLDRFGPFTRDGAGHITRTTHRVKRRLRGGPHVMLKQRCDANYGHWLIEGLPRLAVVEDHVRLGDCKYIVSADTGPMRAIYEDSLALFGIRGDQIVEVGDETVEVEDLLYPTPITRHPWHVAPRCIDVLEQIASRVRVNPFGFDRIYVSRNRAGTRHLLNESEIIAIAERRGFIVVEPETLSLYQQIGLFRSARIVVGNCGAALTNVAFSTEDVTLFALTTPLMRDDLLPTIMSLKRGRFLSQHGVAADPDAGRDSDFTLDAKVFEDMLTSIV